MILVDSIFVHSGGGKALLDYLISELNKTGKDIFYLFDERYKSKLPEDIKGKYEFVNGFVERCLFYNKNRNKFSKIFCLGNIPPHLKLRQTTVIMYFHSATYITQNSEVSLKTKIIIFIKKRIFYSLISNVDLWIVQTPSIRNLFLKKTAISLHDIIIIPFFKILNPETLIQGRIFQKEENSFLYMGTGEPHKNHKRLIDAFCLFYDKYKVGVLILSVDIEYSDTYKYIDEKIKRKYPIRNLGYIKERNKVAEEYAKAQFLIFPSLKESLGLPLIEALKFKCKILAANYNYVKEVCIPSYEFDPLDSLEIYKAFEVAYLNKNLPESTASITNHIEKLITVITK